MSLSLIRPYFRERMHAIGYREWPDSFSIDRIPETIMNRAFHVELTEGDLGPINQSHQEVSADVVLSVLFKGYRSEADALDEAIAECEDILKEICKVQNRTSTLTNVIANDFSLSALNDQNERSVVLRITFSAITNLGIEEN